MKKEKLIKEEVSYFKNGSITTKKYKNFERHVVRLFNVEMNVRGNNKAKRVKNLISDDKDIVAVINGSAYNKKTLRVVGGITNDGEDIKNYSSELIGAGVDNKGVLIIEKGKPNNIRTGLQFKPILIKDGKAVHKGLKRFGRHSRVVLGQKKEGIYIIYIYKSILPIFGERLDETVENLEKLGVENAINLDGGRSVVLRILNRFKCGNNNKLVGSILEFKIKS